MHKNFIKEWRFVSLADLPEIVSWVRQHLGDYQVFLLAGAVGAGKTTFVRKFLHALDGNIIFEGSPTYNYYNMYSIQGHWNDYTMLIHIDMHRMQEDDQTMMQEFEELQFLDAVFFIENYNPHKGFILSHHIVMYFEDHNGVRHVRIEKGVNL